MELVMSHLYWSAKTASPQCESWVRLASRSVAVAVVLQLFFAKMPLPGRTGHITQPSSSLTLGLTFALARKESDLAPCGDGGGGGEDAFLVWKVISKAWKSSRGPKSWESWISGSWTEMRINGWNLARHRDQTTRGDCAAERTQCSWFSPLKATFSFWFMKGREKGSFHLFFWDCQVEDIIH